MQVHLAEEMPPSGTDQATDREAVQSGSRSLLQIALCLNKSYTISETIPGLDREPARPVVISQEAIRFADAPEAAFVRIGRARTPLRKRSVCVDGDFSQIEPFSMRNQRLAALVSENQDRDPARMLTPR
jgi:hypothetical protein